MLAVKTVLAAADDVPTMVFDEVDAGIGGRVADVVGQKLRAVRGGRQVLCVTHLAPIAAYAAHHLLVEKRVARGATRTSVTAAARGRPRGGGRAHARAASASPSTSRRARPGAPAGLRRVV